MSSEQQIITTKTIETQVHGNSGSTKDGFYSFSLEEKSSTRSTVYSLSPSLAFLIHLVLSSRWDQSFKGKRGMRGVATVWDGEIAEWKGPDEMHRKAPSFLPLGGDCSRQNGKSKDEGLLKMIAARQHRLGEGTRERTSLQKKGPVSRQVWEKKRKAARNR